MINFYAPINNLGYGVHSYNLLNALDKCGIDLALFSINQPTFIDESIKKWLENKKHFSKEDIGVMIFHEDYMNRFYGKLRIGFPVFETGITEVSKNILFTLDYILQPSEYGKKYLNNLGFNNVFIVPEGYNEKIFYISETVQNQKIKLLEEKGIVFSHIGKFEERKSSLDIIYCFIDALDGCKYDCSLIAHMYNPFCPEWLSIVEDIVLRKGFNIFFNDDKIVIYKRSNLTIVLPKITLRYITDIYNDSHFGLYASKAEGCNLPLIESIACGVPCITTNWTGQNEYLKKYPSELIISKGEEEIANDGIWFFGNKGNWVKPDLSSMKEIISNIGKDPYKYLDLSNICYNSVKDFTWGNSAKKFLEVIEKIK